MEGEKMTNDQIGEKNNVLIILGKDNVITALFDDPSSVKKIYESILSKGYKQEDVNLVMSEETRNTYFPKIDTTSSSIDLGNKALEGLGAGAAVGGSAGAIAAAIAAIGTALVVPGLGLVIAGPLAASFAGAGAGAALGSILGALIGSTLPDEQAKIFEEGLRKDGIVLTVKAKSESERDEFHKLWSSSKNNNPSMRVA